MTDHTPEFVQPQLDFDNEYPEFIPLPYRAKNIANQTFGRLTAIGPVASTPHGSMIWFCRCSCGKTTTAQAGELRSGHRQSCGCQRLETWVAYLTKHNLSRHPLYRAWQHMVKRCHNPKDDGYYRYGGRGITVCDQWRYDVQAFHDYVSQLPNFGEKGHTLDRIDNNGNYEPGNVRWATASDQQRNRNDNQVITFDGKTQCIAAWVVEMDINRGTFEKRLRKGMSVEQALTTPADASRSRSGK